MQKTFADLRHLAATKRDQAIKAARDEYAVSIEEIAALEGRLAPPPAVRRTTSRSKPLIDVIVDCLPRDRTFGIDDLHGWVKAAEPDRDPSKATVRTNVHRLLRQGVLKRISDASGSRRAVFAVSALEVVREPTLIEYAEQVLADCDTGITPEELLVKMLDAGFKPDAEPKTALNSLKRILAKWEK